MWQAVDKAFRIGEPGGGIDFLVSGFQAPISDVFHHGGTEQEVVLQKQDPVLRRRSSFLTVATFSPSISIAPLSIS